jgi:sugar (pentulose or hexulose) kinase
MLLGYKDKPAVAVCGPTLVPVGSRGEIVSAPLSWSDTAGAKYLKEISAQINGSIDPRYYLSAVYAFFKEMPGLYAETTLFLPCPEYINYQLTDCAFAIKYCAGAERYLWDAESLEKLGLDKSKFPPFTDSGAVIGYVTQQASQCFGLKPGIPVVACGTDFLMTLLGTAAINLGLRPRRQFRRIEPLYGQTIKRAAPHGRRISLRIL